MYTGKELCQGCGKAGTEKARYIKSQLCDDCRDDLIKGKTTKVESSIVYRMVFQHYHAYRTINDSVHELLSALHNNGAKTEGSRVSLKHAFGSNGMLYKIDERFISPLAQCFSELDKESWNLYNERNNLPILAREEIQKQKDRIYNEGVEAGRSLLFQLNSGEISMSEFEKHLTYDK